MIELVESEVRNFLSSKDPEVICIRGHWGVGKTFAWNKYLEGAKAAGAIALQRYSYISLFGINSLDDLKLAVFENTTDVPDIGSGPTLETMQSNMVYAITGVVRKIAASAQNTPVLNNYLGGVMPRWFAAVRETVVCVDDFERRGRGLDVRDVLGLINNLKELKKCKVCLILNDDALEEHKADFQKFLEKVVDKTLKFAPSPAECAHIAIAKDTEASNWLAEYCIKLGISNIRVIKKIESSIRLVEPMMRKFHNEVLRQAVHSLTLLCWSVHEPAKAPSTEFVHKRSNGDFLGIDEKKPISKKEASWNALLNAYEFVSMDELDLALLEGIENGFFDTARVGKAASELNRKIEAGNLDASFQAAWNMLRDSFDDNQENVLDAMHESFFKGAQYIAPMNMSSTITLFKDLGREKQALSMLKHYVDVRGTQPEIFDLRNHPFSDRVSDPDVVQAFKDKYATLKSKSEPKEILLRIASTKGWNPEDITALSATPVDDYYQLLKNTRGNDLRKVISACLIFDTMSSSADNPYNEISKRAKEALKRIGEESAINARRVRSYGVQLDLAESPKDKNGEQA